jgi:hypothetical protein
MPMYEAGSRKTTAHTESAGRNKVVRHRLQILSVQFLHDGKIVIYKRLVRLVVYLTTFCQ